MGSNDRDVSTAAIRVSALTVPLSPKLKFAGSTVSGCNSLMVLFKKPR